MDPRYEKPGGKKIGLNAATARLYDLEHAVQQSIAKATEELCRVLGYGKDKFWTHSLPEELFVVLDSWDSNASEAAAIAYLEMRGYEVKPKGE